MALPKDHVKGVCRLGQSNVCCFLTIGSGGAECAKRTSNEYVIRERLAKNQMGATSDNCSGPPDFLQPVGSN